MNTSSEPQIPDSRPGKTLRVAFHTLGCRLNQVDTEGLKLDLKARFALEEVAWSSQADLYILNSCTVTGKADQECRRLARQVKRRHPASKVVVAGCYAQTQPQDLIGMPEIDGVIGNANKHDVDSWLPQILKSTTTYLSVDDFKGPQAFRAPLIESFSGRSRAFVKIQDGCDLRCAYCLIWQARGPARSRTVADILAQLRILTEAGFPECILAGIHLGLFGRDLEPPCTLPELLGKCLRTFPDLRLRLSSIHPDELTMPLLDLLANQVHLRPHLHISLQSGSDATLRRMCRLYDANQARQAITAAAKSRPGLGLGADVIVGFPGETDSDFQETMAMIEALPFSYLHVFRYSPRPGTPAAEMPDQVQPELIKARSTDLRALARSKQEQFRQNMVGTFHEAVVEASSNDPDWRLATTDNYVTVMVPEKFEPGTLVPIVVEECRDNQLFARVTI